MNLKELQREWDGVGATDPLSAVLTEPSGRSGRWNQDELFAWGEREVSDVTEMLADLGVHFKQGIALDFGCGVGRLTQALARRFQSVYGVDIAPSMIEQAKRLSQSDRCHYLVNNRDDLRIFPPDFFDFIYTSMVLQHLEPRYSTKYIGEFFRTLRPGGVLVFDLPDRLKPRKGPVRLEDAAYNAQIRTLSAPAEISCGEIFEIRVAVRNAGPVPWPGKQRAEEGNLIRLGNHWLNAEGKSEARDDGRTALPHDVEPGAEVELTLKAQAPESTGPFVLELDLVHEQVVWFSETGSGTARRNMWIKPANGRLPEQGHHGFYTEMYRVPRADVERTIRTAGGRLVHVSESIDSDPEWIGYQYFVEKL